MKYISSSKFSKPFSGFVILSLTLFQLFSVGFFIAPKTALAADTGWEVPTGNYTPSGAISFNHPERAYTSNDNYAKAETGGYIQVYDKHHVSTVATGSTITGIEVQMEARRDSSSSSPKRTFDVSLSWNGGTNFTSIINSGDFGTSDSWKTAGGSGNTWGRTWSPTDFTDSNFQVKLDTTLGESGKFLYLDYIQVKIHYTAPADADQDGYTTVNDCNDLNASINPGATETCNNVDDDCDGQIDESLTRATLCGVGICSGNTGTETCTAGNWGGNTCNPFQGAGTEVCDVQQSDEDCDGTSNEGCECINGTTQSCGQTDEGACSMGLQTCTTGAWGSCVGNIDPTQEICDGIDNDCDGSIDEEVKSTFYQDFDGDSYGNISVTIQACSAPAGYVDNATDCNDANGDSWRIDSYWYDGDFDNYYLIAPNAGPDGKISICYGTDIPQGYTNSSSGPDCNDENGVINPSATEICDQIDNDCDSSVDEGDVCAVPGYCGDGQINSLGEQCDGANMGQAEGNSICSNNCKLVPVYESQGIECPQGTIAEKVGETQSIDSRDTDGISVLLENGKQYLFKALGTFVPTGCTDGSACGPNWFSDAGYTTIDAWTNIATQYGVQGVDPDYGAHSLLGNLGYGVGVINWGSYNSTHEYNFLYTPSIDSNQFVIGDRYADWFSTPWQNQTGMPDNSGSLSLDIYECKSQEIPVECPKGTEKTLIENVNIDATNPNGINSSTTLNSGTQYIIEALGTYINTPYNVADAEYTSIDSWVNHMDGYDISPWFLGEGEFDLQINGAFVNWGSYNSTHEYSYLYSGTGSPVNLAVFDGNSNTNTKEIGWYGDNLGSLDAKIYECKVSEPEPRCGDEKCNGNETCSTCESDCGVCPCDPSVELVVNGGFETPVVTNGALWDIFNGGLTSWVTSWMYDNPTIHDDRVRPEQASLELQKDAAGSPHGGNQSAELDSDWFGPSLAIGAPSAVKIAQEITTIPGQNYTISFWFSPRPGAIPASTLGNNALGFDWNNGAYTETITNGAGEANTTWKQYTYTLTATSTTTKIQFSDLGQPSDSLGTYLDDVSVKCKPMICGDGSCNNQEDCSTCPQDCQTCVTTECIYQQVQPCQTAGQGICAAGTRICSEIGQWGSCTQTNQPITEICGNGIDEDCNGSDASCGGGGTLSSITGGGGGGGTPGPFVAAPIIEQGEVLGESIERLPETGTTNPILITVVALLIALGSAVGIKKLAIN